MGETVEVPVAWLKRLVELSKNTKVRATSFLNVVEIDDSKLVQLQGYIESAEHLYSEKLSKGSVKNG